MSSGGTRCRIVINHYRGHQKASGGHRVVIGGSHLWGSSGAWSSERESWLDHLGDVWAVIEEVICASSGIHFGVIGRSSREVIWESSRGVIGGSSAGHWESWRDHWGVLGWSSGGHMGARLASYLVVIGGSSK